MKLFIIWHRRDEVPFFRAGLGMAGGAIRVDGVIGTIEYFTSQKMLQKVSQFEKELHIFFLIKIQIKHWSKFSLQKPTG